MMTPRRMEMHGLVGSAGKGLDRQDGGHTLETEAMG
jgi:hypothetical protein